MTNITDGSPNPTIIRIGDIPAINYVEIEPGQTIDLEVYVTRNQILESKQIKVHLYENRITVDTLGTEPRERFYVDAKLNTNISIGSVSLDEPIMISGNVNGSETPISAVISGGNTYLDVNPLLPDVPVIQEVTIPSTSEVSYVLPAKTKKFMVYAEEATCVSMGFISGGPTITIGAGDNFVETDVNANSLTLYFTPENPCTLKILSWAVS